jgi:putative resolvase
VSSHDQKHDLERQKQVLEVYRARQGWTFEIVSDLGSGMNCKNYNMKGLRRLLSAIIAGPIERRVVTHKDRLLRFGAELVLPFARPRRLKSSS